MRQLKKVHVCVCVCVCVFVSRNQKHWATSAFSWYLPGRVIMSRILRTRKLEWVFSTYSVTSPQGFGFIRDGCSNPVPSAMNIS